ncbi:MAG: serine/threonine-protein phosphatase [Gammaproteobacteria bacterium]|nr:MAG: serine/threonine-protein phosphatase [Gammaproteobacteria bacterium]
MSGYSSFRWTSSSRSDVGNERQVNEDACLDLPSRGLWVVADGMGGHAAGDVASQMLVGKLSSIDSHDKLSEFVDDVEDRVLEVNRRLHDMSIEGDDPKVMGSTIAALLTFDTHVVSMWVGDSRIYRLREGELLKQVTTDHSEVEEMISQGTLDAASALDHPAANVVTRAVGGLEHVYVDLELDELEDKDRYLICSDGLFKDLSEEEIEELLGEGSCVDASNALIDVVLERECADNVTVVVVEFNESAGE